VHDIILLLTGIYIFLRLKSKTSIASKTTTIGPQMPPFFSGSGAFTCSCSGGGVSTGGAGVGVSTF